MPINNTIAHEIKKDFPIFKQTIRGETLTYLDNAATTQKPRQVINAITTYYEEQNANVHRGVYHLSEVASRLYDEAHETVGRFINATPQEIIFTRNSTESLNLLSYSLESILPSGKNEIITTEMEHHSNLIPWQQLARRKKLKLKVINVKDDYTLDYEHANSLIGNKTAIVALNHMSNALGTINNIQPLIQKANQLGAITVVDGSQSASHMRINVKELECDFLAITGHKMLAPTGIGALYGKRELLQRMSPFLFGGGMISDVTTQGASWADLPTKFEAGTPNIAGAIGFKEAISYLNDIKMDDISQWEHELLGYALEKIRTIQGITVYNPGVNRSSAIISFNIQGIHPHDLASLLDSDGVCVRSGHHCTKPLMHKLQIPATTRASLYFYNTFEDIDKLVQSLQKAKTLFGL